MISGAWYQRGNTYSPKFSPKIWLWPGSLTLAKERVKSQIFKSKFELRRMLDGFKFLSEAAQLSITVQTNVLVNNFEPE